ncbi:MULTISPECIES: hypothetical protein [Pasteurellaceae]|nr:hypothetical protein [Mannheimia haemolytica]
MEPRTVKVIYDDGDYFFTLINADEQTIRNYGYPDYRVETGL